MQTVGEAWVYQLNERILTIEEYVRSIIEHGRFGGTRAVFEALERETNRLERMVSESSSQLDLLSLESGEYGAQARSLQQRLVGLLRLLFDKAGAGDIPEGELTNWARALRMSVNQMQDFDAGHAHTSVPGKADPNIPATAKNHVSSIQLIAVLILLITWTILKKNKNGSDDA